MKITTAICALALGNILTVHGATNELIPFVLPWNDTAPAVTSAASFNPPISTNWVRISPEGHLVLSPQKSPTPGERIRFVGVNMTFESGLPPREIAPSVAGRLAKFGINGVRFHHVDNDWCNGLIDYTKGTSRTINTNRLDALHYFISQLKTNGVYADINLLVSRTFKPADGFPVELSEMDWKTQHILGFFNDHALELQKEYATGILTPVNPYTGLALAKDPVAAFVEIINENGIVQKWTDGDLDTMPAVFKTQLQTRWNEWLRKRYPSTEVLRNAWGFKDVPLSENLLQNPSFSDSKQNGDTLNISPWELEVHSGKILTALDDGYTNGMRSLKITTLTPSDVGWHVQLKQGKQLQNTGEIKTLSFYAKSETKRKLDVRVMQNESPYAAAGLESEVNLTPEWQYYTFTYTATAGGNNMRPNFGGFAMEKGSIWISDVQLRNGGSLGDLPKDVSLKVGNVPNIPWKKASTAEARHDWIEFLVTLENRYYSAMYTHLREHCDYEGLIFGTILANSPANVQAQMDIVDSHGYWKHPQFPGAQWDSHNWIVDNESMTSTFENTFTSCALQHVYGKPFFCTEYQHPSPNAYSAEGPLIMGAYAALQDWDGFWFFDYSSGSAPQGEGRFGDFFDTSAHPTKMANLLLATYLFRRADVSTAKNQIVMGMTPREELDVLCSSGAWNLATARHLGLTARYALQNRVAMSVGNTTTGVTTQKAPAAITSAVIESDTGELRWNIETGKSSIRINTPHTKGILGFTDEQEIQLGDIQIKPGKTNLGWSTIALTLTEGESFTTPSRALLIATGQTENTDMQWSDEKKNSVGTHWGSAPVLTECIPFTLRLPVKASQVQVFSLDPKGNRISKLDLQEQTSTTLLTVKGDTHTIWYEIVISGQ